MDNLVQVGRRSHIRSGTSRGAIEAPELRANRGGSLSGTESTNPQVGPGLGEARNGEVRIQVHTRSGPLERSSEKRLSSVGEIPSLI